MDFLTIALTRDELLGRGSGGTQRSRPKVFVAFRMNDPASRTFREELETGLDSQPRPIVLDGRVGDGFPWAEEIRRRIKSSRFVVADVTGPSREVIFELGLAGGKPYLPVVQSERHRSILPGWLTALQIPSFEGAGTAKIAETVRERLSSPTLRAPARPPAVPGKIVWLQNPDSPWCDPVYNRFEALCNERSVDIQKIFPEDLNSMEDLRAYLRAWLVVGCADGGTQDYAMHYFAGDVVSRTDCGTGRGAGQKIRRGMMLLCPDDEKCSRYVADSVGRVSKMLVERVTPASFALQSRAHLDRYRRWLKDDRS